MCVGDIFRSWNGFGGGRTGTCHITLARQIWKAAAETGEERRGPSIVMQGRGGVGRGMQGVRRADATQTL